MGSRTTDFLFANGSFLIGMGSVMAIGGNYYEFNRSRTPAQADTRAIASDFGVVAQDLRKAAFQMEFAIEDKADERGKPAAS